MLLCLSTAVLATSEAGSLDQSSSCGYRLSNSARFVFPSSNSSHYNLLPIFLVLENFVSASLLTPTTAIAIMPNSM